MAPESRRIQLMRAVAQEILGRFNKAADLLVPILDRWPEWDRAWLANAIALKGEGWIQDSQQAMQTATALGAHADTALNLLNTLAAALNTWE
jgi:hypothetical protein